MTERGGSETPRDLGSLLIAQVGALRETGDRWEPWRLVDADGDVIEGVAAFLAELQAAGRSEATMRSYGMDLLRWFRFLWAAGVAWDRATRVEARDFCRWLQIAGKPARAHWRRRDEGGQCAARPRRGRCAVLGCGGGAQRDGAAWLLRLPP